MVAQYVRLTPQELTRALDDPEWAEEWTNDLLDAELDVELDGADPPAGGLRGHDTGKAWDPLRILLHRAADVAPCPFLGGEAFGPEWSYDRPRTLTPEDVRDLAARLGAVPFDSLLTAYDGDALADAYLGPWSRDDVAELRGVYDGLVDYFADTARRGDALLLYLA